MLKPFCLLAVVSVALGAPELNANGDYLGIKVGSLSEGYRGTVYRATRNAFIVDGFSCPPTGCGNARFVTANTAGSGRFASAVYIVNGGFDPEVSYKTKITLSNDNPQNAVLVVETSQADIAHLALYDTDSKSFYSKIALSGEVPEPVRVSGLNGREYKVDSGSITVKDSKTFEIDDFNFAGGKRAGNFPGPPDGFMWYGSGSRPTKATGSKAFFNDVGAQTYKDCKMSSHYKDRHMSLVLQGKDTVFETNHVAVYCFAYSVNFGSTNSFDISNKNIPAWIPETNRPKRVDRRCNDELTQNQSWNQFWN